MSRVVIFGYGNPLRGDDAVGWLAAQELQGRFKEEDVLVLATHQLNPEHAEVVANADLAVFIDASAENPAGTISQTSIQAEDCTVRPFTHNLTPQGLLACARELYGKCPKAVLFAVGAGNFGYGDPSQETEQALPLLLEEITATVRS